MKFMLLGSSNDFENKLIKDIVSAINKAISEDIVDDYQKLKLNPYRSNSFPQLTWDRINNNLSRITYVLGGYTKRGFWNMYSIFDRNTGYLYSFMREKRFYQIAKEKRHSMHYIQAMATIYNSELEPNQLSFFPMEPDKKEAQNIVNLICDSLGISSDIVKLHKVILFSTKNSILTNVSCCTVDRMLEVHETVDLTPFININESIVIEEVEDPVSKMNNPMQGLKFKPKAKERMELNDSLSIIEEDEENKKIE